MAIRNIVKDTDEYNMLHKKCRPVTDFNQKLWDLLDDMAETMYKAEGDRKSTRLNSSHRSLSRMPSSA